MEAESSFEEEVEWCVSQLVLGILAGSPNAEQVKESKRVVDKLQGNKLSYVSKRQLMSVVFGDYRRRMRETPLQRLREELAKQNTEALAKQYKISLPRH
jgi:hypothetical protein